MIIIGIDPGKNGGIVVLDPVGYSANKMPQTTRDLIDLIGAEVASYAPQPVIAYVEKVNAGPKMGSSAAFKFGRNVGELHGVLMTLGLTVNYVTPQKWQKEFGLIVKGRGLGQGDTAKKNRNKAKAQELYPGIKITHAIADALLIAEYGRRVEASRK